MKELTPKEIADAMDVAVRTGRRTLLGLILVRPDGPCRSIDYAALNDVVRGVAEKFNIPIEGVSDHQPEKVNAYDIVDFVINQAFQSGLLCADGGDHKLSFETPDREAEIEEWRRKNREARKAARENAG